MTRMVLGRLWLTSDLEAPKGQSSLSRLWADVPSRHQMKGNLKVPPQSEAVLRASVYSARPLTVLQLQVSINSLQFSTIGQIMGNS